MEPVRLLFILFGILIGALTREYLVGWYSIVFQSIVWTVIIVLVVHKFKEYRNS